MLHQIESIYDYYNDVMRMCGVLQNLNGNPTEEEKATEFGGGLTGQLFNDVQLMKLISVTDFLSKAAKAIDMTRRVNLCIHQNRDTIMA